MGANLDLVQGTVVFQIAVMHALVNSTFNGLIRLIVHSFSLLFFYKDSMTP